MLITLNDVLAARNDLGDGPCDQGVQWFQEVFPQGVEIRDGLVVMPRRRWHGGSYVSWLVQALKLDVEVIWESEIQRAMEPDMSGFKVTYCRGIYLVGCYCDYNLWLRHYEEAETTHLTHGSATDLDIPLVVLNAVLTGDWE